MQPKTELFLYLLLWNADQLMRPGFRNLTNSFESWAYRNGFLRQIAELEKQRFLERHSASRADRLYRLTEEGRLRALGGRDPRERWARPWDKVWRMVLFDVPTPNNSHRDRLRRYLRQRGFGYLQNSVWITPDPLEKEREILGRGDINVESLFLVEARPCAGESDAQIVEGGWDFARINRGYARHLEVLKARPDRALHSKDAAKELLRWAQVERKAWLGAVENDPLLPSCLLPSHYLGQKSWRQRVKVLGIAGRQLPKFQI